MVDVTVIIRLISAFRAVDRDRIYMCAAAVGICIVIVAIATWAVEFGVTSNHAFDGTLRELAAVNTSPA